MMMESRELFSCGGRADDDVVRWKEGKEGRLVSCVRAVGEEIIW